MKDIVTMIGAIAPEGFLIEMLEKGLEKYKETKDLKELGAPCMLILTKLAAEEAGGPGELFDEIKKHEAGIRLLDTKDS
jgi:hypothetical protein